MGPTTVRKVVQQPGKLASVIPPRAHQPEKVHVELGVDAATQCIALRMSRGNVLLGIGMTADRAEELATDLMQFVHELRNGGVVG